MANAFFMFQYGFLCEQIESELDEIEAKKYYIFVTVHEKAKSPSPIKRMGFNENLKSV